MVLGITVYLITTQPVATFIKEAVNCLSVLYNLKRIFAETSVVEPQKVVVIQRAAISHRIHLTKFNELPTTLALQIHTLVEFANDVAIVIVTKHME